MKVSLTTIFTSKLGQDAGSLDGSPNDGNNQDQLQFFFFLFRSNKFDPKHTCQMFFSGHSSHDITVTHLVVVISESLLVTR